MSARLGLFLWEAPGFHAYPAVGQSTPSTAGLREQQTGHTGPA